MKRPTKRAPDAGDSAHIPSSFLRLIIFLAGRLRRPRPSAGNANRWTLRSFLCYCLKVPTNSLGDFFRRPPETTARHRSCQAEPSARLAEACGDPAPPTRF